MRFLCVPILLLLFTTSAFAGSAQKSAQRRAEARAELRKLLDGGNPQGVLARLQYLGEQRYAATELVRAFDRVLEEERRRNVAFVIAGLGERVAEGTLLELTESKDSALRMSGAQGLGRLQSRRVEALLPLLQDPSLGVRREAAVALGQAKSKRVGKPLLQAAKTEGEPDVRAAMLTAVGHCGDPRTAEGLASFLESSSESTRFAAARGLCLLGHAKGFEHAKKLLASEDKFVRRQGVQLFEGLKAKKAAPYLEPLLQDPDKRVAAASARILYQGGDASKLEWLVLASHLSKPEDKLVIEAELETLMLTDDRRKAILARAGIQ